MNGSERLTISNGLQLLVERLPEISVGIDKEHFEELCLKVIEALMVESEGVIDGN